MGIIKVIKGNIKKILKKLGLIDKKKPPNINEWESRIRKRVEIPVKTILPYIYDNSVFIDVGANVGAFTEAVLYYKNNITAYLFEPVPQYYQVIKKKFANFPNVITNNLALSDEKGFFSIWVDTYNLGWNTMISEKTTSNMQEILIESIVFDEFVKNNHIQKIDVIKIDVEGAEFKVLRGMKNTLLSLDKKPVILCEIAWGKDVHPYWNDEVEIFEWLFNHGYKRFDYTKITSTTDMLFVPN